jgi:twitching motility protein PilT
MKIDELLNYALDSGASDLHLSVGSKPMVRINGTMHPLNLDVMTKESMESILPQVLSDEQVSRFRTEKEIDFSAKMDGKGRFRVNFFSQLNGIAGVFRTIPDVIKSFEDLGIPPMIKDLSLKNRGLILLTGPTGSGKSTTLATMVDHINENRSCHIITIEDPVEYFHSSKSSLINQRELGANTNSFSNALRAALREDPDVILVGEMRDLETTSLSLTAAETGHLVMSTLSNTTERGVAAFARMSSSTSTMLLLCDLYASGAGARRHARKGCDTARALWRCSKTCAQRLRHLFQLCLTGLT